MTRQIKWKELICELMVVGLVALGCEKALEPDTGTQPDTETIEESKPAITPEEARSKLKELDIQYSKDSFIAYAGDGNIDIVRLFVESGMDVNVQNDEGLTALMVASYGGYSELVRFLIDSGSEHLSSALGYAAYGGHLEIMLFLSEKGGDLGITYNDFNTPLTIAAYGGHLEVVQFLVGEGYDDKRRGYDDDNEHGDWALVQAARGGHLDVVRYLVDKGFEINPTYYTGTSHGDTPLIYAAYGGHLEVVRFLVESGADIHIRTNLSGGWSRMGECSSDKGFRFLYGLYSFYDFTYRGCTAFIAAVEQGHDDVTSFLIDHWMSESGADDQGEFGVTALMFATQIGDLNKVQILIDNGADVNAETAVRFNALLLGVHSGNLEMIRLLLDLGSDVNHQTAVGSTALMFASYLGHLEVVRFLVESGADVNTLNRESFTALMSASYIGHLDIVRFLVENGADISIIDRWQQTALDRAKDNGHQEVVDYLQSL